MPMPTSGDSDCSTGSTGSPLLASSGTLHISTPLELTTPIICTKGAAIRPAWKAARSEAEQVTKPFWCRPWRTWTASPMAFSARST